MLEALPRSWKEEFALAAAIRREDILFREKIARADALARERTEEVRIRQLRKEKEAAALEAILAPPERIAAFRTRLDTYDAKTVEALMLNQEQMDTVRRAMDDMLQKAHVLPDGRRVFKTIDGQKVFDEHGTELAPEVVDPKRIDEKNPRWETFKGNLDQYEQLRTERRDLHDFQDRLDTTRERLDKGGVSERDMERMKEELASAMPDRVRRKLDADDPAALDRLGDPNPPVQDMEATLRRTGLAPAAAAAGPT